jgi:hypothetical protein
MSFSKCQNHPGFGARARHFCECPSCITTPLEAPEKL